VTLPPATTPPAASPATPLATSPATPLATSPATSVATSLATSPATPPAVAANLVDPGIAVANGLTSAVAATWSATLVRTPRVLVPIEMSVLMVREATASWAQCGMQPPPKPDPSAPQAPVPAATLKPPPFANLATPRARGAYLQWYLPRGLTAGSSDATLNTATFPAIPDRWLVLRISGGQTGARRAVRGWVLEAGAEPPLVSDLATWTESGVAPGAINPLTALGHGDLAWAGYFDNVLNRLGFADTTLDSDQVQGPIAYLACGWYSDPTLDPLGDQKITSLAAFNATLQRLGWGLDSGPLAQVTQRAQVYVAAAAQLGLPLAAHPNVAATGSPVAAAGWWPTSCVLHGAAVGISWPDAGDTVEAGGPPAAAAVTVAIGNTMGETLGALVARATGAPDQAAIVEALQLGVIRELDAPDGRARLDAQLHASSFLALSGGAPTTESITIAPSGPPPAPALPPAQPAAAAPAQPLAQATAQVLVQPQPQAPAQAQPQTPAPALLPAQAPAPAQALPQAPAQVLPLSQASAQAPAQAQPLAPLQVQAPAQPQAQPRPAPIGLVRSGGALTVATGSAAVVLGETAVLAGGLREAVGALGAGVAAPPVDPGGAVAARRAPPRFYLPKDPMLLIQGGKRAFVHDSTVFTEDGILQCRLSPVTELSWTVSGIAGRLAAQGADILAAGVTNGSVPVECQALLAETALLDPGSAPAIVAVAGAAVPAAAAAAARGNVAVEQTAWYALRDPRVDHGPLLAQSGIAGMLPAPFAIAPAARPWTPLHLDWSVEYLASPHGIADWQLGEIDFTLQAGAAIPQAGSGILLSGQSTVTGGASATLAAAVRNAVTQAAAVGGTAPIAATGLEAFHSPLAQQLTARLQQLALPAATGASPLADVATALGQMDVLSCGLDGLLTQLRGGVPGDGSVTAPPAAVPAPFVALRGGFLRVVRLRLVDGYGQYLDLCGSDATHPATGVVVSGPLSVPGPAATAGTSATAGTAATLATAGISSVAGIAGLAPRFSAAARVTFRFMSAVQPGVEANATTSPVCGFLMPNHLDGSLEFFNADGSSAGTLQARADRRVTWQDAPGTPTTAGQDPGGVLSSPHAAALARSLVDWGITDASAAREPALAALLRTIDTTRWTVDPYAHAGDEHLALLLGHPVCVLRALLRLDVADPVAAPDNTLTAVPVRLGALAQWQDGLFGYFTDDDYTVLHVSDAAAAGMARPVGPQQGFLQQINAVPQYYDQFAADLAALPPGATAGATPVSHPYIDTSGVVWVRPNQTVQLTLLVEPLATVHATAGLVPRKEIGLRRAWVQDGLAAIAPTFQFGPVLVDPQQIRMPLATDLNGTWVWDYRADATAWAESPATNATDDALLSRNPATAIEGWLRLTPPKPA
jgi:hypothetical protein